MLVLADDFSGAAEIAGAAMQFGLAAVVRIDAMDQLGVEQLPQRTVLILDCDSRSISPALAYARLHAIASQLPPQWRSEGLFKKIDSVLRGPVIPEIRGCCHALGISSCLIVNANPRKGRIVRSGQLWIGDRPVDQTDFARDPQYPRTSSYIRELLDDPDHRCRVLELHQPVAQEDRDSELRLDVANAQSSADLLGWAERAREYGLAVGAAEFFEALLQSAGQARQTVVTPLFLHGATLIVSGTAVRNTLDNYMQSASVTSYALDQADASTLGEIRQRLHDQMPVRLTSSESMLSPDQAAELQAQLLAQVEQLLGIGVVQQLWIEGGGTASQLVRKLGWTQLRATEIYADGVVGLRPANPNSPQLIVKPGSYPWPVHSTRH